MSGNAVIGIVIVLVYFAFMLFEGWWASRKAQNTAVDYFIASRGLGPVILLLTVYATINSSFGFLGLSGLAFRFGPGIYSGLFIGACLAGIFYYLNGYKFWLLGRKYGFLSPAEMFGDRFESPLLRQVILWSSLLFLLPYIGLQVIGGGQLFAGLSGGAFPYLAGAIVILVITLVYTWLGGMRSVALTDAIQGLWMIVAMLLMFFWVFTAYGGFAKAGADLAAKVPGQFTRPGPSGFFTWQMTASWVVLIAVNMTMQPQLFQRFLAAKSTRSIKTAIWGWVALSLLFYFPVVLLGMYGPILVSNVQVADRIIPAIMATYLPFWLQVFVSVGVIAAIMSTMDSQLLSIGSMFGRDLYRAHINKAPTPKQEINFGRIAYVVIAILSFLIAIKPPALIGQIASQAFAGAIPLVIMALGGLYWKRTTAAAANAAVIVGELVVLGTALGFIPRAWWLGFDVSVPAAVISAVILVVVSLFTAPPSEATIRRYFEDLAVHEKVAASGSPGVSRPA